MLVFLSFVVILFFPSCKSAEKSDYARIIMSLQQKPIDCKLDSMQSLSYDIAQLVSPDSFDYKLIVFSDSTECSPCVLKTLFKWKEFKNKAELVNNKFAVFFIFSPPKQDEDFLYLSLRGNALRNQMFFDNEYLFRRSNPSIPDDKAFHTFLLDKNNNVILVGNPIENEKIKELMLKEIAK